ncbi:MAG: DUF1259 domain-containing protein [Nitrospirales bacterium]
MRAIILGAVLCLSTSLAFAANSANEITRPGIKASGTFETSAIERAIGKAGEMKDDVYKVSLPRTDLTVSIKGVKIKPGLALGSWVAFKKVGALAVIDGDLVLTEDELAPVFAKLRQDGIEISALHNHLIGESPRVMYLHIAGKGDPAGLATHIKEALDLTATPFGESQTKMGESSEKPVPEETGFDAEQIQKELGHKGTVKGGVLQVSIPRSEQIKMGGTTLPPSMGMATALNFQASGDNHVAATGDFVMTSDEVDRVTKALTENGIAVTALHNHLVHGTPNLFFMHFWVNDSLERVVKGLKAGLNAMKAKA